MESALDIGLKVGVPLFDFRDAFDTVNNTVFQGKLKAAGISGNRLCWVYWLHVYVRAVCLDLREQVSTQNVRFRVTQGSILGPKLFSTFANDFAESITDGDLHIQSCVEFIIVRNCDIASTTRGGKK